jgi:Fur family peroxide stress response transcriptional regulator
MSGMERYKNLNLKLTPQRLAIINYLSGNRSHPSADEIYSAVSKRFPTMSLATVYNTLEALKRKAGLQELTIDPGKKRYDPDSTPHHHLMCVECKSLVDIFKKFKLNLDAGMTKGFEIKGNHIEFYGLCPKCKKTKARGL